MSVGKTRNPESVAFDRLKNKNVWFWEEGTPDGKITRGKLLWVSSHTIGVLFDGHHQESIVYKHSLRKLQLASEFFSAAEIQD